MKPTARKANHRESSFRRVPAWLRIALPCLGCAALALTPPTRPAVAADSFIVIANSGNPVSSLTPQQLSDLFLKKVKVWPDGTKAAPVDLVESAPARARFSWRVHGKGAAAVKAYWQTMIFSGHGIPPPEKASATEVVAFVSAQPGAIGYVPEGTPLGPEVKVVTIAP